MPGIADQGARTTSPCEGGASDVIASAESLSFATASSIPACSSHVLAVAVRMVGNCCIVFCSRDLIVRLLKCP